MVYMVAHCLWGVSSWVLKSPCCKHDSYCEFFQQRHLGKGQSDKTGIISTGDATEPTTDTKPSINLSPLILSNSPFISGGKRRWCRGRAFSAPPPHRRRARTRPIPPSIDILIFPFSASPSCSITTPLKASAPRPRCRKRGSRCRRGLQASSLLTPSILSTVGFP